MPPGKVKQSEPTGPRPPLANLIRLAVVIQSTANSSRIWSNVFHVLGNGPIAPSVGDLNTLANSFLAAHHNAFNQFVQADYIWARADVSMLDGSGVKGTATGNTVGGNSNAALTPQVAVAISWQTYAYYRGGKPRTYLGGLTVDMLANPAGAAIAPARATALHVQATSFRNAVNALQLAGVGLTLGYVQYFKQYQMLTTPRFYGFVAEKVHERVDSQRRRSGRESLFLTA